VVSIDIPVSADLQAALDLPPCDFLALPKATPLQLRLPNGARIQAINDLSKAMPTDCSMSFSLMLQMAPFLAAIDCPLKILGLIKPLIDVINNLPPAGNPLKLADAIVDFGKAAEKVAECFIALTPGGWIPFICDLLRLIRTILSCLISQMETLVNLMGGLSLQIQDAADNPDLLAQLQCAQENADAASAGMISAIEPIKAVLALAEPIFGIAGIEPITLAPPGGADAAASMQPTIQALKDVVATIDTVTESLCP
jgi:hypothetical protein